VDPKTVQAILRHAKSDVTMDIYTHSQDEEKRNAVERYESRWLGEKDNTGSESQIKN
jgi:integrase